MSYKEHTMYSVECDRCGKNAQEGSESMCWEDKSFALDDAKESHEFIEIENPERILCNDCWEWDDDEDKEVEKPPKETP